MREYIHFFENSDLRDAYEYGNNYTEPYVSYTPIINEYEVQSNGESTLFTVTKQGNSYLIGSVGNLIITNSELPIINSNVFYTKNGYGAATKLVGSSVRMFVFEVDLLLTEESTELTLDGVTYYLIPHENSWSMYTDSEHTQYYNTIYKYDIVAVPSSTSTDFVHYNLSNGIYNGHKYIDLSLPSGTKWAKMNVGANNETDAGLYFAWGETQGYTASQVGTDKQFSWDDYALTEDGGSTFTKYNASDNKTHLELIDDAASVNMGGDWHMPNRAQCLELFKETKNGFVTNAGAFTQHAWDDTNGYSDPTETTATISGWNTAGYLFFKNTYTSVTEAITAEDYLFIPIAGYCEDGEIGGVGIDGSVWASAFDSGNINGAWGFDFGSFDGGRARVSNLIRYCGLSVRGVVGQMDETIDETTPGGREDIK